MTEIEYDKYLVPFDFTDATRQALEYTLVLAKTGRKKILVVHVVKAFSEVKDAEERLNGEVSKFPDPDGIVETKVIVGSIFEDIENVGKVEEASLIVMGVHNPSGLKKIFGTDHMKIVANSGTPFLLVQEEQVIKQIDDIVMPFSFDKESVQVTDFAAALAKKYDATIHLVGYRDSDEWLLRDMKTNEVVVRKRLTEYGVKHDTHQIATGENYEEELLKYAKEIDADLIAAAYFSTGGLRQLFHSFIEAMILNDQKIPVLTINSAEIGAVDSRLSFLTV